MSARRGGPPVIPHPRFVLFLGVFALTGLAAAMLTPARVALVLGFDIGAAAFALSAYPLWRTSAPAAMRAHAARDDGGRALLLAVAALILLAILVALGGMMAGRARLGAGDLALVVTTLVLAWFFANLVYAFHYAHLYYDRTETAADRGGLTFPGNTLPVFSDFCYFSFVLGMTFQVSDVTIASSGLRRTATVHALLAFFFNLGVLALTINVLAGVL